MTMKKNNTKSVADTKKAFQQALMKKAATKVASCSATSENNAAIEAAPSEVVASPKTNAESFKKALDLLLSAHPADGRNKRADFSTVLSLLLKMNVDTKSAKEISSETEKSLNILGFTATKAEGKESICKDEIPELVMYLFDGYQKEHPQFCAIDADILHNCPNELDNISKKIWHPIVRYIACQTASYMTEEDAEHLLSGKPAEISDVLKNVKCADQTRAVLVTIAPELGKLIRTLKASSPIPEVIPSGNCPFAGLNPNDFPSYEEEQPAKTRDFEAVFPEDKDSYKKPDIKEEKFKQEEMYKQEEKYKKEEIYAESTPKSSSHTSKQESNLSALERTVNVLNKYGDMLRALEVEGFSIEDAKSLVDAEALGFSIKELLYSPKVVETLSSVVNALK